MAAATITWTGQCAGGGHVTLGVTGAKTFSVQMTTDEMLGAITDDEMKAFFKVFVRFVKVGKTAAQAKTALQAGVTVSV